MSLESGWWALGVIMLVARVATLCDAAITAGYRCNCYVWHGVAPDNVDMIGGILYSS